MEIGSIAVRCIVSYLFLLVMLRTSGKRVVSQATAFDFVVSLIVGDMVDDLLWAEVPLSQFAVGVGVIFFADTLVKVGAWRGRWFHNIVNGSPRILMEDGVANPDALRREQLSEVDLEHLLRLHDVDHSRWSEVRLGIMEIDHHLSLIRQRRAEPAQRCDALQLTGKAG